MSGPEMDGACSTDEHFMHQMFLLKYTFCDDKSLLIINRYTFDRVREKDRFVLIEWVGIASCWFIVGIQTKFPIHTDVWKIQSSLQVREEIHSQLRWEDL